jgi:hypothetical protein
MISLAWAMLFSVSVLALFSLVVGNVLEKRSGVPGE